MNRPATQNPSQLSEQVKTLSASALALASRGQTTDAEQIYRQILAIAPYHASSLSFMAAQAYSRSETGEALALMDKAVQGNPRNPLLLQTRAQMYRGLGRLEDSIRDLDQAIALQPDLHTARFQKAINLKDAGDWNGAIKLLASLMRELPELKAWTSGEAEPGELSALALEVTSIIRAAQLALVDAELQPLIATYGKDALQRLFEGIASYAGLREKTAAAPGPETRNLCIPGLDESPVQPGWPADLEPDLKAIGTAVAELAPPSAPSPAPAGENAPNIGYLWRSMPETPPSGLSRLLPGTHRLALLRVPGGRHDLRAVSGENWRLTGYTLLEGPGPLTLHVGQQSVELGAGTCLRASHLAAHAVENRASAPCVLLRFETWHPGLSQAEREGLEAVEQAFQRFRSKYL